MNVRKVSYLRLTIGLGWLLSLTFCCDYPPQEQPGFIRGIKERYVWGAPQRENRFNERLRQPRHADDNPVSVTCRDIGPDQLANIEHSRWKRAKSPQIVKRMYCVLGRLHDLIIA